VVDEEMAEEAQKETLNADILWEFRKQGQNCTGK
jgi:hypothetical protein